MTTLTKTQRITLRRINEKDAENLYRLDNDPKVMVHINGSQKTPMSFIQNDIIPTFMKVDSAAECFGFWAVIDNISLEFHGWCNLRRNRNSLGYASIGYRFQKDSWGKGLAAEAITALMSEAFSTGLIEVLTATTYEYNVGSRRLLEKLGFVEETRFDISFSKSDTCFEGDQDVWEGQDLMYTLQKP